MDLSNAPSGQNRKLKHWTRPKLQCYAIPKATQQGSGPSGSDSSSTSEA